MNKASIAKLSKIFLFIFSSIIILGIIIFFPYKIYSKNFVTISEENFDKFFKSNIFYHTSKYVSAKPTDKDIEELVVEYKLFNLINIKSLKVNVTSQQEEYFVGGNCILLGCQFLVNIVFRCNCFLVYFILCCHCRHRK